MSDVTQLIYEYIFTRCLWQEAIGSMADVTPESAGQLLDIVAEVNFGEAQECFSNNAEGENDILTASDQKPLKKKKKKKKSATASQDNRAKPINDDYGVCALANGTVRDNLEETQTQKKKKKKKKAAVTDADVQAIPKTDILLLYDGSYKEPTDIKPANNQTYPPSIPVCELYPDGQFPKGLEMPYGSSDVAAQQRVTNEEKRALERAQVDIYNDVRQAAEAHRHVRKYMQTVIKPGRTMIDICTELENYSRMMIKEQGLLAGKQNMLVMKVEHKYSCKENSALKKNFCNQSSHYENY